MASILRLKKGTPSQPWIFFDQLSNPSALVSSLPTEVAQIYDAKNSFLGSAFLDIQSKLCARIFSDKPVETIDQNFYIEHFKVAAAKRKDQGHANFYRLINYEGDNLGGLAVDRFGETFVVTTTVPVHSILINEIIAALKEVFAVDCVVHKHNKTSNVVFGKLASEIIVVENNTKFAVNLLGGQKSGYYFDQVHNHHLFAEHSAGKIVLDAYCYIGGFGINALTKKAKHITFVDTSSSALNQVKRNLELNNFDQASAEIIESDVVKFLESTNKTYDLIALDPPPLIKDKSHKQKALKTYEKIMKLALSKLNKNGQLLFSSCSHHMKMRDLKNVVTSAFNHNGCGFNIILETGHNFDHPVHPKIPETRYLNTILVELAE